jgi:hypothetical protein
LTIRISRNTDPTTKPSQVDVVWTNTVTGQQWYSTGTSKVSDWVKRGPQSNIDSSGALVGYNSDGFVTQTAPNTFTGRGLIAGSGINISNAAGKEGNPSISTTITQYTDEQAKDAVGNILTDTTTVDLIYNDFSDTITADVKDGLPATKIATGIVSNAEFERLDGVTAPIQTQLDSKVSSDQSIINALIFG